MTTTVDRVAVTTQHRTRARALAVAAAVGAMLACWILVVPLLGVQLIVSTGPGATEVATVGPALVAAMSLLASLPGLALLVSMPGPLTGALTVASTAGLMLLHLSVAAALIPLLRRTTTGRP